MSNGSKASLVNRETLKLASDSALFFSARLGGAAFTFFTHIALANWMGQAEFGRYAEAISWTMVLTTVCVLGIPQAGMRVVGITQANDDHGHLRGFLRRSHQLVLAFGSALALVGACGIWLVARARGEPPSWPLILAFACLPVFSLIRLHSGLALAFSRFALSQLPNTVARPGIFLALIWIAWLAGRTLDAGMAVGLHLIAMVLIAIVQAWLFWRAMRIDVRPDKPSYDTRAWLRLTSPLLLVSLYANFYPELNVVLLGLVGMADEDIGVYNAAFRTAYLISFGIAAVNSMTMPRLSRLHAEGDQSRMQQVLAHGTLVKIAASLAAVAVFAIWGKWILGRFGAGFERGYPVLMLLAMSQLVKAIIGPVFELLNVTGHQDTSLVVSIASLVATAVLMVVVAPLMGIEGAALVALVVTTASALWLHRVVQRFLGVQPSVLGLAPPR